MPPSVRRPTPASLLPAGASVYVAQNRRKHYEVPVATPVLKVQPLIHLRKKRPVPLKEEMWTRLTALLLPVSPSPIYIFSLPKVLNVLQHGHSSLHSGAFISYALFGWFKIYYISIAFLFRLIRPCLHLHLCLFLPCSFILI